MVEVSSVIFGTDAKWHFWVPFAKLTFWFVTSWLFFFSHIMWWGAQLVGLWLLTLDLLRCQGLELGSLRTVLFWLVFDCGMSCSNLSLLVMALCFLNFSQSFSFTRLTARFLPALRKFLFHLSFSRELR